jgi:type I restriction-modification system DNA methylase subunit
VIHEFSVEVAGQGKRADYAFRTGADKFDFLVEAKKPSVKVETSQEAAFQIRRYGWSAKLPINILTDFEHLAVYDCRVKPSYNDKASMGRIVLIHYKDYVSRWNEIVEIFSPEAVRKGSFSKYTEGMKGKKGTADVDDAFLQEIERWRELLAKNIALRNDDIDIDGLNYSVQMTIDRIVFLRICEERGIEPENQLLEITNTDKVYEELCELFKRADTKYNSGLFHFKNEKEVVSRPDDLTLSLAIDDKVLKDIISNLYYPKSPYAFLYIPSDILGQVYERFLGKVIRLTDGHQAKVEEKPEVRKAGGVYYTPTYIVEYIVKNTVGKLVENKSPKDVVSLKVVDPACGSGTFLLGAYQFLLDWHLNWYSENEPEKAEKNKAIVKVGDGYRLTTAKKKEILLNNIHGVDIDAQAVEVTKLSLLLKVLESASGQLGLGMERVLPDLGNNIKFGNSLIGFDYFEGQLLPNDEERARINPFDWKNEFKDVFVRGGFDVVIGNPPYGFHQIHSDSVKPYFKSKFLSASGSYENYFLFYEQSLSLLKVKGIHGFIAPVTWLTIPSAKSLREYVLKNYHVKEILWLSSQVFENAQVNTLISITQKEVSAETTVKICDTSESSITVKEERVYSQKQYIDSDCYIGIFETDSDNLLLERLVKISQPLKNFARPCSGYNPYEVGKGQSPKGGLQTKETVQTKPYHSEKKLGAEWKPEIVGRDLGRYSVNVTEQRWIKYGSWLAAARDANNFLGKRLLVQEITGGQERRIVATYYDGELYYSRDVIPVKFDITDTNPFYILGIVNSKLITWYHHRRNPKAQKALFPKVLVSDLANIPVRAVNFSNSVEKARHDKIVSLVEQMLSSQKSLAMAQTPQQKERLERQIEVTDKAIDSLVYDLYGLNEEEIKIVEGE